MPQFRLQCSTVAEVRPHFQRMTCSELACSPASDVDDEGGPHKSLSPGAHDRRICYDEGNISVEDLAAPESLLIGAKHVAAGMHWSIAG